MFGELRTVWNPLLIGLFVWAGALFFGFGQQPLLAEAAETSVSEDSRDETSVSGRIFSDFYIPTGNFFNGSLQQISGSAWLQLDPKVGEGTSAHLILTADQIAASSVSGKGGFSPGVREGYVHYFKSGWNVRMGKMILPWGKSDGVNPTDFLTAKDYGFFNPDDEVRRIGAVSVLLSWTPSSGNSPFTFTFVGTPVFPQSVLLLAPGQIPSGLSGVSTIQSPATTLSNSELALKVAYSGEGWDASVLVFKGWNHLPEIGVNSVSISGTTPTVSVSQGFHQYRALGGDSSVSFGKYVLRGEAAYVWTENGDGQNPMIQPSHLDAVVGLERGIGDDFRVQTQFLIRYFPYFTPPSQATDPNPVMAFVYQQVAGVNALIQNYQDVWRPAASFRLSYSNDQNRLAGEVFLLGNFLGGGLLLRPEVTYRLSDSLKATLGLNYYAGPADRPLGVLAPYNALYTELKYVF
ncbi:MAG: hypothetical protein HYX41_01655 [Bdellovibrio sp.]|nr:hypothetical protein [Bdellovibrio sp.]